MGGFVGLKSSLRIAVVANTAWYLFNFRLNLIQALRSAGHTVELAAPADAYADRLRAAGFEFEHVPISGGGINPLVELRSVVTLWRMLRRRRIDLVLSYTPKGNLYSALACIALGVPFVPNVSGLGRAFIRKSLVTLVAQALYRFTFRRAAHVFFQNRDDMSFFVNSGLVQADKAERVPGSGVDLARFVPTVRALRPAHAPVFLLAARMLWDKGVGEYVEAARKVRQRYPAVEFRLLGFLDVQNPSAIPRAQVEAWVKEGVVNYLGSTDDVLPHLRDADCVVLPSYREGCPRVLLEAAAMAKPIITTDAPGCRDTVDDGVSGFLCRLRDADDLATKMLRTIEMDRDDLQAMGQRGREKVMREFDERIVIDRYLDVASQIAQRR